MREGVMDESASRAPVRAHPAVDTRAAAWVVSPHLLVAQAVTAALQSAGSPVAFCAWENLVRDAESGRDPSGPRSVVAIFDGLDNPAVVDEIARLLAVGDVRVAVVTTGPSAFWWGGLVADGAVDVVTMATSVGQLADVVRRFLAGQSLMEPDERDALHAEWAEALDRRQDLVALIESLSPQQLRVLELLASGRRVHEVAELLGVADGTVRSHVKTLRNKIGARTQLEAVAMLRQVHDVGGAFHVPRPRRAAAGAAG
jgi:DNA-binding NarL/FixJ family response regulator